MPREEQRKGTGATPIPSIPLRKGHALPPLVDPTAVSAEQYRAIKAHLDHIGRAAGKQIRKLVITSPAPGDGKTLTALNLALVLAQDENKSVLMIDADLRKPGISDYFVDLPKSGLIELLAREVRLTSVLFRPEGSRLLILPSGSQAANPAELLGSRKMEQLLELFGQRFDCVVIDTPPVVPFIDADELSACADGALLIVRSGQTPRRMVIRAMTTMSKHNLLGVVFNDVRHTPLERYYYHYDAEHYGER
jgi:capsular exopolysaccharide synthesis family protein